jgi:hypothetical protein
MEEDMILTKEQVFDQFVRKAGSVQETGLEGMKALLETSKYSYGAYVAVVSLYGGYLMGRFPPDEFKQYHTTNQYLEDDLIENWLEKYE